MAKRKRDWSYARTRCICCQRLVVLRVKKHGEICPRCWKYRRQGPGLILRAKARLDTLIRDVLHVQTWFRNNRGWDG